MTTWEDAPTLAAAKAAAEQAVNLITGPHVTGYGDLDGNGTITGPNEVGLLPGEHGEAGLVRPPGSSCVQRDVLGGSWADPGARWADLRDRIARWTPTNNTFPALRSHPQRVIGWASLTLRTKDLVSAREYAGHAQQHLDVTRTALTNCH